MRTMISALLLAVLAGPASALTQAPRSADGGVTIRPNVSAGAVLDPGDRISFQYQSARDAAVIVFDIDTQGYVTLLNDDPVQVSARETQNLPGDEAELTAGGEPGIEFVFAIAVSDPGAIDPEAFASLRDEARRINGDPFIAANMIAGELVRDISQQSVFIGYTYFYVSERVEYPCYLCGTCDGSGDATECDGYRMVQNFDRNVSLAYPLARGYDMVEVASQTETVEDAAGSVAIPDEPTEVSFYPYGSQVYYADPMAVNLWYNWGYYDPFLWYGPYYPYGSPSWSIGFGWGWGWGYGGYYCSGWYDPWYGYGCGGYYPYYPDNGYYPGDSRPVSKYKSQYKSDSGSPTLTENRKFASKHDGDLRVASKSVKSGSSTVAWRSKTQTQLAKNPFSSTKRVKTSVSGTRSVTKGAWASGRSDSYKNVPVYRSQKSQVFQPKNTAGKSVMERSGSKRQGNVAPGTGGNTRVKSGSFAPSQRSTPAARSKGTWSTPSKGSAPRSSSSAPRMNSSKGSNSSPSARSGSFSGGSRSSGGGMRGGAMKGGRGR